MSNEKGGRILDKDFEDGIAGRAGEIQKDVAKGAGEFQRDVTKGAVEFQRGAQKNIDAAQKYAYDTNYEVEAVIREHPKAFVLGSFIGGVALGTLLSRGNK